MKKYNTTDKNNLSIASMIIRGEPVHIGHVTQLIFPAMLKHDLVYIYVGGSNVPISIDNPFNIKQKIDMFKILLGQSSKVKIIPLQDIGATTKQEWVNYVAEETDKMNLKQPEFYYAGDEINAKWMTGVKNPFTHKEYKVTVVDRLSTGIMSGTDIRKSIMNNGYDWKKHVPEVLHQYIIENFPFEKLRAESSDNFILED